MIPDGLAGSLMLELFGGFWGFLIELGASAVGVGKARNHIGRTG